MQSSETRHVRTIPLLALLVLACVVVTTGCGPSEEKDHEPAFLLVQSSKGFEYDGSRRLTVTGTSPGTVFFSDRPDRIAGHMPLEKAYEWGWSGAGDDSFLVDPPNATLSILEHGEMGNVVLTMSNVVLEGESISFDVDILEGELPLRGGPNTLFIDVIGRPATPGSVAGVHRRTRRRSAAVGVAVGASAGYAGANSASAAQSSQAAADSADQAAGAANQAAAAAQDAASAAGSKQGQSVEQQLSELKDMLDKELITQQDYDTKKKQLLEGM